jgi:hypothetical protein
MELGRTLIVNPISFINSNSTKNPQIPLKHRSPKKLFSFFICDSQKIIFIFFFGSPCYYFHFLFRFAQDFYFLFLSRFAQKNWPHNSLISSQFFIALHLSLGFTICYNIVVPRERKKPCAVRLKPIGPKFRALVYIW